MKLSTKFTIYTIIAALLLLATGAIAAIYGAAELPNTVIHDYPDTLSGEIALLYRRITADHTILANYIFYVLSIIGFGGALLLILQLRRKLVHPLLDAVKFALSLADNKFPTKLDLPNEENDEIGELVSSLNFMRDRLQSTFLKLQISHENEKNARLSAELLTEMKNGFIQHIIPDILENLDVIATNLEIFRRGLTNGRHTRKETVIDSVRRALILLTRHFGRLEDLSRIGIDKDGIAPQTLQCADFLSFVIKLNAELFESRGIRIEEEYRSGIPQNITADPDVLRMLLTMAIHTIADNSESGELLKIGCTAENDTVIFSIRDGKLTQPREPLYRLYRDFIEAGNELSQADKRLTALLVLNEWVQALGGKTELTDSSADSNLTLRIILSDLGSADLGNNEVTCSRRLASQPAYADPDDAFFDPTPAKILLAESNRDLAATAKILLEADKHTVSCVPDAANLRTAVGKEHYDLIVISLHISEKTLRTLLLNIHSSAHNAQTPVAAIFSSPMMKSCDFSEDGLKYRLTRPINFQELRHLAGRFGSPRHEAQ
ncbi:MAG: HAMP domain-containing protein [Victivallaceae bacterium]|nr:HAMP domain-containing protein [Victivallaceae bacterium]